MRSGPRGQVSAFVLEARPRALRVDPGVLMQTLRAGVLHSLRAGVVQRLRDGVVHLLREGVLETLKFGSLGTVRPRDCDHWQGTLPVSG